MDGMLAHRAQQAHFKTASSDFFPNKIPRFLPKEIATCVNKQSTLSEDDGKSALEMCF